MNFDLSPAVEGFREGVRTFLEEHLDPIIPGQGPFPQMDTPEKVAFVGKLAERGYLGLTWPTEYGGRALPETYQMVLLEELQYAEMPPMSVEVGMVGETLYRHGSEAVKQQFLPRIIEGRLSIALGYTEPDAGSDLASLKLSAVRQDDEFVVNGQKMFTSAAHFAEVIWLAARTDPEAPKHQGISLFLVDTACPGIEVQAVQTMTDHRTNMVFFTDVHVPVDRLVGRLHEGWRYLVEALDYERLRGLSFGGLQRDLDTLVDWASREGRWDDPDVARLIGRASVVVEGVRTHFLRALGRLESSEIPTVDATMLKVALTEARQELADDVLDLLGPAGLLRTGEELAPMDGRFEHNWRAEIISSIVAGANELQRNIIASRHLRLPAGGRSQ